MRKQQYIVVEHRQPEYVKTLQREIAGLKQDIVSLKANFQQLETKYGYEVYLNGELVDMLRENQIPFRPLLSHAERSKRYKEAQ